MRAALWFVGLFGVAVAAALFAGSNQGTVTLFWWPHRYDFSLNMVLALTALTFFLLYVALRGLASLLQMPHQARRWRVQQKERAMHHGLLDALSHLQAGRFLRARKSALAALSIEDSLQQSKAGVPHGTRLKAAAHMVAADASHALQDTVQRDAHWREAIAWAPAHGNAKEQEMREGAQMRAARWALDDRDAVDALRRLAELPQGASRRTIALRIRLKASRLAGQTSNALDTARLLAKHRAFSPAAAASVVRGLVLESIRDAQDPAQLQQFWLTLDSEERSMPEIAMAAAQRLMALDGEAIQARAWLLPVWEHVLSSPGRLSETQLQRLVAVIESCLDGLDSAWLARIESATMANPREASLQYLAGMACVQRQLWGKAQQSLERAAPRLQDSSLRTRAWQRLALMAEHRSDAQAAAHAWKQAALAIAVLPANPSQA